jgi:hypothetical protein
MPFFLTAAGFTAISSVIIRFLIGTFVGKLFLALGVSFITFQGADFVGNLIYSRLQSHINSLPYQFLEVFSSIGGMSFISIICSAYMGALSIRAVMGVTNRFKFGGSA